MWYALAKYAAIGPILRIVTRPQVVGREHLPRNGPVILAANHHAFIDSLLLCLISRRRVTFVAKSEYFERPGAIGAATRWFFSAMGQIPIDRRGGAHSDSALGAAIDTLTRGEVWAIHPEGTRTPGDAVPQGHTGVVRVAQATGAPIIPIGLRGSARVNPPHTRIWRPHRVAVVIGRPVECEDIANSDPRAATDRIMREVAVLAGQPYVDTYASRP
jgi:1-acyl-sn-glycerol-3-phosphate acyltransferase